MITRIEVGIAVKAPFATRGSGAGSVGVDLPLARDGKGRLMIAGSHIIGKLAQATRELGQLLEEDASGADYLADLRELYAESAQSRGEEADALSDGRGPRRGLTSTDFVVENAPPSPGTRTRIAIDNVTETVSDGMMQVIEQPAPAGAEVLFTGTLFLFGTVDEKRLARLRRAIDFVPQVGGLRTVGFGASRCIRFESNSTAAADTERLADRLELCLSFASPFCAGEARNTPNTYSSADHVPGGVIKGAVARQLLAAKGLSGFLDDPANATRLGGEFGTLAHEFSRIIVRHALPVPQGATGRKARVLPDSLASIEIDGQPVILDLAGLEDPSAAVLVEGQVPIARFDWKPKLTELAEKLFARPDGPRKELRIRTEIDPGIRAAKPSRLFGIEYTLTHDHDFLAEVDLTACADPTAVGRALQQILNAGLAGIGRGGAFANVTMRSATAIAPLTMSKHVVAVLQTAALLRDPSLEALDLRESYEVSFRSIGLPEGWRLKALFVRERLAGGGFFLNRLAEGGHYAPWLLTEPGATFVFEGHDAGAPFPEGWFRTGLPVPAYVLAHHGISDFPNIYRVCPYLPENGYGELVAGVPTPDGVPSWQSRAPVALGLDVEIVDLLVPEDIR